MTDQPDAPVASIKAVADYLRTEGESLTTFSKQWRELPDSDKNDLRTGIGNGTFTY